jgi:putative glutamine amidotransferase
MWKGKGRMGGRMNAHIRPGRTLRPLVLISACTQEQGAEFEDRSLSLSLNYCRALLAAGGLPWVTANHPDLAYVRAAVKRVEGVLLTGGEDIDPKRYTRRLERRVAATLQRADPDRDAFELLLVAEVLRQRKPLLCICRGHQLLNVALGGTLFADIRLQKPRALDHCRTDKKDRVVHEIDCVQASWMARIAGGGKLAVNSSHHQAVARLAAPLRATGVSRDGIIESMELAPEAEGLLPFLLSVQFHPERLFTRHAAHLELFRVFVRACRRKRSSSTT